MWAKSMYLSDLPTRRVAMLTSRQLTALSFLAVAALGVSLCLEYARGRALNPTFFYPAANDRLIYSSTPFVELPPPLEHGKQSEVSLGPKLAVGFTEFISPELRPDQRFLQVASTNRGVADCVLVELGRKGFSGRIAPGTDAGTYRVLVGPLARSEITRTKSALEQIGFTTFLKVY